MKKKKSNQSPKGALVKGFISPTRKQVLVSAPFKKEIKKILGENSGSYVLYSHKKLYYVGIAKNLYGRLCQHTRDKHKKKWDEFSVFIIGRGKYLKDIETIAQLISNPKANVWKGRFKEHYKYDDKIKTMVKDVSKSLTG